MKISRILSLSAGLASVSLISVVQAEDAKPAAASPAPAASAAPAASPAAAAPAASPAASPAALDFGDFKSSTLTSKAWAAYTAKDYDSAIGYANKCIESFKQQALDQQKALTAPLTDKEQIFAQWALNDVGTAYFVLGQSYEKQGKTKEATEAYKFLSENLPYTQCWDPKGWFWNPANAAKERVKALEFDTLK